MMLVALSASPGAVKFSEASGMGSPRRTAYRIVAILHGDSEISLLHHHLNLRRLFLLREDALLQLLFLGHHVADHFADFLEARRLAGRSVGDLDEMEAEIGRDDLRHLAFLRAEGGAGERLDDDELVREVAEVAALFPARAVGVFAGGVLEADLA